MKKSFIIITGGLVFAVLFFEQRLGINVLLYNLFITAALLMTKPALLTKKAIVLSMLAMLATATAVMVHGTTAAMTMCVLSTLTFLGFVAHYKSSLYISWLNGVYTLLLGTFHDFLYQKTPVATESPKKVNNVQLFKLIAVPMLLVVVFTALYRQANPVFNAWVEQIDLRFLNALWMLTAVIGSFIMSNIVKPVCLEKATHTDAVTPNELTDQTIPQTAMEVLTNQKQVGVFSIGALNLLLVVVLLSEFMFLGNLTTFKPVALSQAVHQGIYASICSILIAIGLIAYYYRGALNFLKNNKQLQQLTYLWIGLNTLLVVSIFIKNYLYIDLYGLTYKRIGVMIYLVLCVAGLTTTGIKVYHKLNFMYLLRRNLATGYVVLCFFALINWPAVITAHNIAHGFKDQPFLNTMRPQNAVVLYEHGLLLPTTTNREGYQTIKKTTKFTQRNWQEFNLVAYRLKQLLNERHENFPTVQ